jgi:hypothetical protein
MVILRQVLEMVKTKSAHGHHFFQQSIQECQCVFLLTKLSRCAWKVLNLYLTQAVPYDDAKAGAAIAEQSFDLRLVEP